MKKLLFFATMLSMALFSCTSDDEGNVVGWKPGTEPVISSMLKANFNGGSMIVSSTGYLQSKGMLLSRAFSDYTDATSAPGSFASDAAAVTNPYKAEAAPAAVPNDAEDVTGHTSYWGDNPLVAGKSYCIDDTYDFNSSDPGAVSGEGDITIYVTATQGQTISKIPTNAIVKIMPGAKVKITTAGLKEIDNWGTLIYGADINEGCIVKNYNVFDGGENEVKVSGTLYSSTDLNLKKLVSPKYTSAVYVDGNLACESNRLQGKLYVKKEWSGGINVNIGLKAHVGSVNTIGKVNVSAGAQLMVETDITAAEMQIDGAELVVKGKAEVSGLIYTASESKSYIELMLCENYTANASDVWVGCKSDVAEKFELNGNSKFTMANGVYVHAKNAVFASNTHMVLMDNAYFKVDYKLQLNNANTNKLEGVGDKVAIVKAKTLGANYEDFVNTFVGNIGVDFEDWDYSSSTGLIDNCTNLSRLGELQNSADYASIAESDCNPGFTGSKVPTTPPAVEPVKTTYEVHYVVVMDNGEYVDIATADTGIDANVGDNPKPGLTAKTVDGYTFSGQKNGPDALVEDAAQNKFYLIYNKNEESEQPTTPPATDPDPTPDPTPAINCGVTITLPVDIKGEWIAQADDFAIHNGDYLYENIAAGTVDVEDPNYVTDTGHNSIQNYVVVNAGERVTISIEDLCAMYEAYRGKTKICDDEKSVYFGKEVSYMDEEGIFTIETYIWPCKKTTESDGVNDIVKIYPVPASEYGVIADGVAGKYLVGGENTYETYLVNNKYLVRAQAYQSYNGGGQGAAMTSYIKVTFHIQDITPKSAE